MKMNEVQENQSGKIRSVMKTVSVALMVMFFFPLCTVSCSGNTIEVSGSKATFGMEIMGEHLDGNILCGLLFLIPALILTVLFIKALKIHYTAIIAAIGAVTDVVVLIAFNGKVTSMAEEAFCTAEFTWVFYGMVLLNIILMPLAYFLYRESLKLSAPDENEIIEQSGGTAWAVIMAALVTCAIIVVLLLMGLHFAKESGQIADRTGQGAGYVCSEIFWGQEKYYC